MFFELGGGSNYAQTLGSGPTYVSGYNLRASIGWKVASNFSWRIDAFTNDFESKDNYNYPCPTFGCPASVHLHDERVNGLIASGLVNFDPRGIFYMIGGAGFYGVNNVSVTVSETHFGLSAGAGIAVPMGSSLRGVVEARWLNLYGETAGPTWFVPITLGVRFQP